jgi:hypothetical protein
MRVHVLGIGVAGPGLGDWLATRAVLTGQSAYTPMDVTPASPAFLPPNERRRVSRTIRLALQVASEATRESNLGGAIPPAQVSPVFASAWGDLEIVDRILAALAQPERPVSPTHFHNSVHNAAAGYWSIGTGAPLAVSAIAGDQATFAAGLLEAATLAATEGGSALLVAYDAAPPPVWRAAVPVGQTFAAALLLSAAARPGCAAIDVALSTGPATGMADAVLEQLRRANPAAAALPLLECLARGNGVVELPYHGARTVRVAVHPGALQ